MSSSKHPQFQEAIVFYLERGLVLVVAGSFSAIVGLAFTLGLIHTNILAVYLKYISEYVGINPMFLFDIQNSTGSSVAQNFIGQWIALTGTGVLLIVFTLMIGGIRQLRNEYSRPKDAFKHTSHKDAVLATVGQMISVGVPLTLGMTGILIFYALGSYSEGTISEQIAKQIVWSGLISIPMLTFFEISIIEITR